MKLIELEQIIEEVKREVLPSPEDRRLVEEVKSTVLHILHEELPKYGYDDCEVSVQGSVAKDTWLPENKEIDIFVIFPKSRPREDLENLVNVVIDIALRRGIPWIVKYAQHPYVQLSIRGIEVDIVPCYRIEPGEKPLTAADRTPLHTRYVLLKLQENPDLCSEIRVFKRFLRCLGIYGAEIKVEGFSGYLAELLVIYYRSFINLVLDVSSKWRPGSVVIDIEGHYRDQLAARKLFENSPLIVIDPVDPMRNAAAAVSVESMSTLILGCKLLLRKPSLNFFRYPPLPDESQLKGKLLPPSVVIVLPYPERAVPDTVWGELKRLARSLWHILERYEFKPYHIQVWTDEKDHILVTITLRELDLPEHQLHEGPPVYSDDALKFIEKYFKESECLGPFIMRDRVYVIRRRKYAKIEDLLKAQLPQAAPKHLKKLIDKALITRIENIEDLDKIAIPEVRRILIQHLLKRPLWLSNIHLS